MVEYEGRAISDELKAVVKHDMDLVYITHDSEKWVEGCFASLACSELSLKEIFVWVVDNASQDNTLKKLEEAKKALEDRVGGFSILSNNENIGFGSANNMAARMGRSSILCFLNIDTQMMPDTLKELSKAVEDTDEKVAMWEMRQLPYEHPKLYDPLTMETSWCSGAAVAVRRCAFERVAGFDEEIFLYAEDVDLSWRLRSFGYRLRYVPRAAIYHYSYRSAGEIKPAQYICGQVNSLMLRYRFGSKWDVLEGHGRIWWNLMRREAFPDSRKLLWEAYHKGLGRIRHFKEKKRVGSDLGFQPKFLGYEYEQAREGAFCAYAPLEKRPLVSVILRTCGRPTVLREALVSLRNQTYTPIEIVIVEDGPDVSRKMVKTEFNDLNILYEASGSPIGRSRAGNRAMELAHGKYLNFLDDDDLFYADHVETLVAQLETSKCQVAYGFAFETPIAVKNQDPYEYTISGYYSRYKQNFDRLELCYHNYIPIQCALFERELFERFGGLDEELDYLEDWDMWVRYAQHTDFLCVPKTTSIYRVPDDPAVSAKRQKRLDDALGTVRKKQKSYCQPLNAYDAAMLYRENMGVLNRAVRHPWIKRIIKVLIHR